MLQSRGPYQMLAGKSEKISNFQKSLIAKWSTTLGILMYLLGDRIGTRCL